MNFQIDRPLNFAITGKFEAHSDQWIHSDEFPLTDYELIVGTEGNLYLMYANEEYTVSPGSFLLLPPLPAPFNRCSSSRPSSCSFYWLQFTATHPLILRHIESDSIIPPPEFK